MKCMKIVGAAGMLVGFCLCSQATILGPGGVGLDPAQAPGPAALDTLITPYSFGALTGTITSWVTMDPANPLGGLSFYYQVNNTGTEEVSRLSASDFGLIPASLVDVSTIVAPYDGSLSGGVAPTTANRSPGAGSVVGFDFLGAGEINGGEHSEILVVNTSYQNFQLCAGSVIDNNSVDVNLLGPSLGSRTIPMPEPSTLLAGSLLLIPLGATALRIVRKR